MSEEAAEGQEPNGETAEVEETETVEESAELDPRAQEAIAKKNREAKNLRKRLKELEPLAEKAKELEEANKTNEQKMEERASGAESRAGKAEQEAARLRVALKKGLTETQAKRLIGENEEELEADADELLDSFNSGQEPSDSSRRPQERLRPGAVRSSEPEETDPSKLAAMVPRAFT